MRFSSFLLIAALTPAPLSATSTLFAGEIDDKVAALGDDVSGLWQLAQSYTQGGLEEPARAVAARILQLDEEHEGAHKTLRHHSYAGAWFETYTALSTYRRAEAKRMWDEEGVVRFRDGWAPPEDVPFLRMQWQKDDSGKWRSPAQLVALREEVDLVEAGWEKQDTDWVHPDDFGKWREGLWKCGADWLPTEGANQYHSDLTRPWRIPGEHYVVEATTDRESARWAVWYADQTYADLVRMFDLEPEAAPVFITVNGIAQYNAFAAGDPNQGLAATETSGFSSVHYAYFADSWYDTSSQPGEFRGKGVCYWDTQDPGLAPYGQHAVRHAAAQSFLESVDPSWDTVSKVLAGELNGVPLNAFWGEKRISTWMRYGAASYCERFFHDKNAKDGTNPWWARAWAMQNLNSVGGIRDIEAVFDFQLDPGDPGGSTQLIHEAGALVSFAMDGGCKPVEKKWAAFKKALSDPKADIAEAREELEAVLLKNASKLEDYMQG